MSDAFRIRPRELGQLREDLAMGSHSLGLAVQAASMAHTPVRGGFRSFNPDQPIGGTLRRSHYTVTYLDGRKVAGPSTDDNGQSIPADLPTSGIVTIVGTNAGYGLFVHEGTSRMEARPFLVEGLMEERASAPATFAAGVARRSRR